MIEWAAVKNFVQEIHLDPAGTPSAVLDSVHREILLDGPRPLGLSGSAPDSPCLEPANDVHLQQNGGGKPSILQQALGHHSELQEGYQSKVPLTLDQAILR